MPKQFRYYIGNQLHFDCELDSERCKAHSKNGNLCRRQTVIGLGYCWSHLMSEKKLRIKDSAHGKGLFAHDKTMPFDGLRQQNRLVFAAKEYIIDYDGEDLGSEDEGDQELKRRYDYNGETYTAPYAVTARRTRRKFDGACRRGIGNLANHSANANQRNAKIDTLQTGRVIIRAIRPIYNGEEILVNYDHTYGFNEGTRHTTSNPPRTRRHRHYRNPPED